jgi:hypothetical protein
LKLLPGRDPTWLDFSMHHRKEAKELPAQCQAEEVTRFLQATSSATQFVDQQNIILQRAFVFNS